MGQKIKKMLIANYGDNAIRIIRACKELGIETVAIYTEEERSVLHTRLADVAICIGESNTVSCYSNVYNILSAAEIAKVDAIHPGIRNGKDIINLVLMCEKIGYRFIGPDSRILKVMDNTINGKLVAKSCGVPTLSDYTVIISSATDAVEAGFNINFPVIMKSINTSEYSGRFYTSIPEIGNRRSDVKETALPF